MAQFKNGQSVRQILPAPITGKIAKFVFDESDGTISYVVESMDADGAVHQRHFLEGDLELAQE